MMRRVCFSFEASGHKFKPLDGLPGIGVLRLYCPTCGRVIPANQAFNNIMWETVELPPEAQAELDSGRNTVH
jgi:hypothetical protein